MSGVDLDHGRTGLLCRVDLLAVCIDEQRHAHAHGIQPGAGVLDAPKLRDDIEPAFGGELLAPLRHQAYVVRTDLDGDADHLPGHRCLQVHARAQLRPDFHDVALLDMPPVFAQMQGDRVGARLLRKQRRPDRIRIGRAAHLTQRGHVVDVHPEFDHSSISSLKIRRLLSG